MLRNFAVVFTLLCLLYPWAAQGADKAKAAGKERALALGGAGAKEPQLALSVSGEVHLTYGIKNTVYCVSSIDGGKTFHAPVVVGKTGALSLGRRRGPRVAVHGKHVAVSAIGGELGHGKDGELYCWRSADSGATWSPAATVNDLPAAAREGLHAMAYAPDGKLVCIWLDFRRGMGMEIYQSSSADHGQTWSENTPLVTSPSGSICPCCHPNLTFDAQGSQYVMWRDAIDGNRDMYLLKTDPSSTALPPIRLGTTHWELDQCPMEGGSLAIDADNHPIGAWMRERKIVYSDGSENESVVGQGEQPTIAATRSGTCLAWLRDRPGDLFVKMSWEDSPRVVAQQAVDPVLAYGPAQGDVLYLAWESGPEEKSLIQFLRIPVPPAAKKPSGGK